MANTCNKGLKRTCIQQGRVRPLHPRAHRVHRASCRSACLCSSSPERFAPPYR